MKIINTLIYIVFGLSIWTVLSIKLELFSLLQCHVNCLDIRELNDVFLNLSYSYVAGFIVYVLTVKLPHWIKKKASEELVNRIIEDFHLRLYWVYYSYYIDNIDTNQAGSQIIKRNQDCNEIAQVMKEYVYTDPETRKFMNEYLEELAGLYDNFTYNMANLTEYLSYKQYRIWANVRKNNFTMNIRYCKNIQMENLPNKFIESFNDFISLLTDLKDTINKKKIKKS